MAIAGSYNKGIPAGQGAKGQSFGYDNRYLYRPTVNYTVEHRDLRRIHSSIPTHVYTLRVAITRLSAAFAKSVEARQTA